MIYLVNVLAIIQFLLIFWGLLETNLSKDDVWIAILVGSVLFGLPLAILCERMNTTHTLNETDSLFGLFVEARKAKLRNEIEKLKGEKEK